MASAVAFLLFAGGLFAINKAIRRMELPGRGSPTYYVEFPFQNDVPKHDSAVTKSREDACYRHHLQPADVHVEPRLTTSSTSSSAATPGFSVFLSRRCSRWWRSWLAPRRRPGWQWLVLASGLLQGLIFIVATPYTWSGGGVGNRYFFGGYGVMLFVLPPIESLAAAFAPWAIGGLFVAPMVLNPFVASFHPADNAKSGPLRLLPVELTLVNDLPVNTEPRARAALVRRHRKRRSRVPGLFPRRQRLRPRSGQELLDARASRAPSSSSRPTGRSVARRSR